MTVQPLYEMHHVMADLPFETWHKRKNPNSNDCRKEGTHAAIPAERHDRPLDARRSYLKTWEPHTGGVQIGGEE
jgi:hypothetical protein